MIRKLFNWIFKSELDKLNAEISRAELVANKLEMQRMVFDDVLSGIDVSVDVHEYDYTPSWAVISLQGQRSDYIKFIELGNSDIMQIEQFLRRYERHYNIKVDASPRATEFLRVKKQKRDYIS